MANGHNLIVAVELADPLSNYERVVRALSTVGAAVKVGTMLWYIDAPIGAREAEGTIKAALGAGDTMMVVDASANFAILHNLPVAGAQVRRFWNTLPLAAPDLPPPVRGAPARAPAG